MVPIASRILKIVDEETERPVVVRLFMPYEDDRAWRCDYEIGWPGQPRAFRSFGSDAFQAIQLAMRMIGVELYTSAYHKAGTLVLDVKGAGFGFPVPTTAKDLLEGDDITFFG